MAFKEVLKQKQALINKELKKYFSSKYLKGQSLLIDAAKYSVFSGGKRFRPILTLMTAQSLGKDEKKVLPAACALELIHNFSLIHDDLPCMDDDNHRRGKLTCHRKFNEATALLAGDALIIYAFKLISAGHLDAKEKDIIKVITELADASGFSGMTGGQAIDILLSKEDIDDAALYYVHSHKTGALIRCAVRLGAILSGATAKELNALTQYGQDIGLIFQITDDILDMNTQNDKISFPAFYGLSESKKILDKLAASAIKSLKSFGKRADNLREVVYYLLNRKK